MSSHGGAVAEGSPYLGSIFPVVMLPSTRPESATHRGTTELLAGLLWRSTMRRSFQPTRQRAHTRLSESRTSFLGVHGGHRSSALDAQPPGC